MDYSLCDTDCDELLKRYRVALSREEVQAMVEETYAFLAMQMGVDYVAHQPKDGLRKRIGEDLDERVGTCLANQCADRIIAEEGLPATMEPVVDLADGFSDDAAFDFEVTVFLKPAWELTSYDPVVLPLPDFEVTEEQVERNVQAIVEDRAKYVEDAEARQVDEHTRNVVSLDTKKCGMPVQALTVDSIVYRLGDGLLPSPVEEQLLGMAPGETKEFSFNVTSKNFLGLDVEETMDCVLRVSRIVKKDTPDVTDAWVKENVPGAHDVEKLLRPCPEEPDRAGAGRLRPHQGRVGRTRPFPEAARGRGPRRVLQLRALGAFAERVGRAFPAGPHRRGVPHGAGNDREPVHDPDGHAGPGDRAPRARLGRPCSALGPGGAGRRPCAHAVEDVSGQGGRGAQDAGDERAHLPAARDGLALEGARLPDGNGGHASKIAPGVNDGRASKVAGLRQRRPRKQGDPWR